MPMTIPGLDKLRARLEANIPKARTAAVAALYQFGEEVMTKSKKIVPLDTGNLMNSGHVECPEMNILAGGVPPFTFDPNVHSKNSDTVSVVVGYGGPARKYAWAVHEDLDPRATHNAGAPVYRTNTQWTRPGSGPKYLETVIKAMQGDLPDRILKAYKNALKA